MSTLEVIGQALTSPVFLGCFGGVMLLLIIASIINHELDPMINKIKRNKAKADRRKEMSAEIQKRIKERKNKAED